MSIAMITTFPMVIGDWNKRIRRVRSDISGGRSKNRRKESVSFLNCPTRFSRTIVVGKCFFPIQKKNMQLFPLFGVDIPKMMICYYISIFIYFTALRWFFGTMKTSNIPTPGGASGRREKGRFGLALPGRPRVNSFKVFPW